MKFTRQHKVIQEKQNAQVQIGDIWLSNNILKDCEKDFGMVVGHKPKMSQCSEIGTKKTHFGS